MRNRFLLVIVAVWIVAFLLTRVLWPDTPGQPQPSAVQLPFFIGLAILEPLFFGIGVAFLIFGFPWVQSVSRIVGMNSWPIYLSIGWLLVSWWPHDNLHRVTEGDLNALIGLEYGFHVTLMIVGATLAWFFIGVIRQSASTSGRDAASTQDDARAA